MIIHKAYIPKETRLMDSNIELIDKDFIYGKSLPEKAITEEWKTYKYKWKLLNKIHDWWYIRKHPITYIKE